MSLILGMDIGVFLAWILTILAAILCLLYGLYHEFLKNSSKDKQIIPKKKDRKKGAK